MRGLSRATLAWGSLAFAAILLLNGNFLVGEMARGTRVDLTEDGRYTIADGTRQTLAAITEPIRVRVYFSSSLGDRVPQFAQHFDRLRTLLDQYGAIAQGRLVVEYYDPEPFSKAEELAIADRVRGVPITTQGDLGYFGVAMSNSVDDRAVIPFLDLDRDQFLEYDLTSKIYDLATARKRVVGVITGLAIDGSVDPQAGVSQPWRIMDEMRQFFDVEVLVDINEIPSMLEDIPDRVDVLLVVQPLGLSERTLYAIDQYALRGGKVLIFADPSTLIAGGIGFDEKLLRLLAAWGVQIDRNTVAGDLKNARPSETGNRDERVYSDFVASIALGSDAIAQSDVVGAGIERLHLMTPGIVTPVAGASTSVTDILTTSPQSAAIDVNKVRAKPDPVAILRDFKPGGVPLSLAVRVVGPAATAFADGQPPPPTPREGAGTPGGRALLPGGPPIPEKAPEPPAEPRPHLTSGDIHAIVVGDVDMLYDTFWVQVREFFGQQLLVPTAGNSALLINALENLSGDTSLIALRGRGISDRPFELVQEIQVDAEKRYRETERGLDEELQRLEARIKEIEASAGGAVVLGEEDRALVENFRKRSAEVRDELREVKLALRRDIDRLEQTITIANVAGVPVLFAIFGILVALWRRGTAPARKSEREQGK